MMGTQEHVLVDLLGSCLFLNHLVILFQEVLIFFTGAFGYFEVTHDISQYTKAKIFSEIGKRTPLAVRFSTVGGESGSADTAR